MLLHLAPWQCAEWVATTCLRRALETYYVLSSDLRVACSSLVCSTENDHRSCLVNRHMLLLHLRKLSRRRCVLLIFLHGARFFFFVTHGRAYTHIKLGWELANIEIKLLMFSSCFLLLLQCNALLSREVSANSADDIISDKSVFLVQVLNTSPYNVYYQWFGPGLRLHLGMARDCFFFLSSP